MSECTYSCCMCFSASSLRSGPKPFRKTASESDDMMVVLLYMVGGLLCSVIGLVALVLLSISGMLVVPSVRTGLAETASEAVVQVR